MPIQLRSRLIYFSFALAIGSMAAIAQAPVPKKGDLPVNRRWQHAVGDWIVICSENGQGRKACAMSQTLSNSKTRKTLAALALAKDASGRTQATVTVPMGVLVSAGLRAGVDQRSSFEVPFRTCLTQGCIAQFDVSPQLLGQISRAETFSVAARTVQQQPLTVEFSLRGFAKAREILAREAN